MSNLLLDTCALIWLAEGGGKLSDRTISLINESHFVYTSTISAWEISLLCFRGQLQLAMPPEEWFNKFTLNQNVQTIDISPTIAFLSNNLPWHHKDPADRFIISTAMSHNLTIVSADKQFSDYDVTLIK